MMQTWSIRLIALCCLALSAACSPKIDAEETRISEKSATTPSWGFYQILWNKGQFLAQLDTQLKLLGGHPEQILFFRDLHPRRGFPTEIVRELAARNLQAVISLELLVWGDNRTDYLKKIIDGDLDEFFVQWGRDAAALGELVVLRFGFEMNGDWFSWGQRPSEFKQAWRRAHTKVSDGLGAAGNIQWMFCPNVLYNDQKPEAHFAPYYPGNKYVDLVGLDGYNFGDNHSQWHKWQSYEAIFSASLEAISEAYSKPLWIAEIGCVDDPRKAVWLEDALEQVSADERITSVIFFHYDKRSEREHNWRLDSDANSLAIFKEWNSNK